MNASTTGRTAGPHYEAKSTMTTLENRTRDACLQMEPKIGKVEANLARSLEMLPAGARRCHTSPMRSSIKPSKPSTS